MHHHWLLSPHEPQDWSGMTIFASLRANPPVLGLKHYLRSRLARGFLADSQKKFPKISTKLAKWTAIFKIQPLNCTRSPVKTQQQCFPSARLADLAENIAVILQFAEKRLAVNHKNRAQTTTEGKHEAIHNYLPLQEIWMVYLPKQNFSPTFLQPMMLNDQYLMILILPL